MLVWRMKKLSKASKTVRTDGRSAHREARLRLQRRLHPPPVGIRRRIFLRGGERRAHGRHTRARKWVNFGSPRRRCRPGLVFTRQGRPKASLSAAFRQRRKIGAGFGRPTHGGLRDGQRGELVRGRPASPQFWKMQAKLKDANRKDREEIAGFMAKLKRLRGAAQLDEFNNSPRCMARRKVLRRFAPARGEEI